MGFNWEMFGHCFVCIQMWKPASSSKTCLLGQTRNEPSLVSDGNRKAVVLAAIHWWFCWKMMYSVSKSVMVFGRCQSLVNLPPCFWSGIHFVIIWGHITRKSGFYFSGRVLQFGISLSFSQSSPLWYCSCPDTCLTCVLLLWREIRAILCNSQNPPAFWISLFPKYCSDSYWVSQECDMCRLRLVLVALHYLECILTVFYV